AKPCPSRMMLQARNPGDPRPHSKATLRSDWDCLAYGTKNVSVTASDTLNSAGLSGFSRVRSMGKANTPAKYSPEGRFSPSTTTVVSVVVSPPNALTPTRSGASYTVAP